MQILQEVQKCFVSMGIDPKLKLFNLRNLSVLIITSLGIMLVSLFLLLEAKSGVEYMEAAYVVIAFTGSLVSFACTILITKEIFSYIKAYNEYLNECK